jgi:hypothetical protein
MAEEKDVFTLALEYQGEPDGELAGLETLVPDVEPSPLVLKREQGMVLVFLGSVHEPLRAALLLDRRAKRPAEPRLPVRMAVHRGSAVAVSTPSGVWEATGEGIAGAERLVRLGDEGHILLSEAVAQAIQGEGEFRELLQRFGPFQESNGHLLQVFNLCSPVGVSPPVGNHRIPRMLLDNRKITESRRQRDAEQLLEDRRAQARAGMARSVLYVVLALVILGIVLVSLLPPDDLIGVFQQGKKGG